MMAPASRSKERMDLFVVLHESHLRPPELEFEYMVGELRGSLDREEFGPPMTQEAEGRLALLAKRIAPMKVARIVTEDFAITRASAAVLSRCLSAGKPIEIAYDSRICESDLSFMDRELFDKLAMEESQGDVNATLRAWRSCAPEDFSKVVENHLSLWNEICANPVPQTQLFVLHVEGVLLFVAWALQLPILKIDALHIPRGVLLHIRIEPKRDPVVRFICNSTTNSDRTVPFSAYG